MLRPQYGNWVSMRLIYVPAALGLAFLGLAVLFPISAVPAGVLFCVTSYFAYARYQFDPQGENVQDRIVFSKIAFRVDP